MQKIGLIIIIIFNSCLIAQNNLNIQFTASFIKIFPDQVNNYFNDLNKKSVNTKVTTEEAEDQKIKLIEHLYGYGIELEYKFSTLFSIKSSWENYLSSEQKFHYYTFHDGGFFPDILNKDFHEIFYNFSSYSIRPSFSYNLNNNFNIAFSIGPTLNFGNFSEEYFGYYSVYRSTWHTESKYFIKSKSKSIGYLSGLNIDYNIYSRISLGIGFSYQNIVHEFDGDFSMSKAKIEKVTPTGETFTKNILEFDQSGFSISAGLKIGIL